MRAWQVDAREVAGVYRDLRKGREDNKDEPGAADFYYGEMEMRRLAGSRARRPRAADHPRGRLTRDRGVLLIFDEVVTGFRMAPGGAQEYYGVTADLTCLAKAVAGGLPGAALVGGADLLDSIALSRRNVPRPRISLSNVLPRGDE